MDISRVFKHISRCRIHPSHPNIDINIQKLGSRKGTLCWRFGAAERAAGGSVSAFRGRRATGGSSLDAGQLRLQQRLLGRHRGGVRLSGAAKRCLLGCRAGNGGRRRGNLDQSLQKGLFRLLRGEPDRFPMLVYFEECAGMEATQASRKSLWVQSSEIPFRRCGLMPP